MYGQNVYRRRIRRDVAEYKRNAFAIEVFACFRSFFVRIDHTEIADGYPAFAFYLAFYEPAVAFEPFFKPRKLRPVRSVSARIQPYFNLF